MPTKTVRRPWALRLIGAISLLVLSWTFSPQLLSFFADKDKGENLPPELAVVPPDAFAFLHARPAEIWGHETVGKLRQLLKEHKIDLDSELVANPADVESVSLVVLSAQTAAMLPGGFGRNKPAVTDNRSGEGSVEQKFEVSPRISIELNGKDKTGDFTVKGGRIKEAKSSSDKFVSVTISEKGTRATVRQLVDPPEKEIVVDVLLVPERGDGVRVKVILAPRRNPVDKGKKVDDPNEPEKNKAEAPKEPEKKKADDPKEPAKKGEEAKRKISKDVHVGQTFGKMGEYVVQLKYPIKFVEPAEKDGVEALIQGARVVFKQTVDSPLDDKEVDFIIRGVPDTVDDVKVTIILRKRGMEPEKKKVDEPKKEPEKTKDDDKPGKTEGSQAKDDFPELQALIVVKMKDLLSIRDRTKFASLWVGGDAKKKEHNDNTYLVNAAGNCLWFLNETTFVAASTEAVMKKVIDRPEQAKASGAQAAALKLAAAKHQVVVGFNLAEPTCLEMKKRLALELKRDRGGDFPGFVVDPLLEAQTATLTVDLAKDSRVKVEASLSFPGPEKAAEAVGSLQDSLALARVFVIGRLLRELDAEAGFNEEHRKEILFVALALKQAESALRAAVIERRQAVVNFKAEAQFDVDYLRGKAKIAADNFVVDPTLRSQKFRSESVNNLKQMALAMHSFNDVYRYLPPPAIYDKDGKPLLSWRVAILPFIEQQALYNEFKLDEPWDSEHNIKLLPTMPRIYAPLRGVKTKDPYTTFYQIIVGPGTPFEFGLALDKNSPFGARGSGLGTIPDGTSNTIGIVEAADPVPWSKPADVTYDPKKALPKIGGTLFPDMFNCSLLDGSVRSVRPARAGVTPEEAARRGEVSEQTLRNAITCNDGMPLGLDWYGLGR